MTAPLSPSEEGRKRYASTHGYMLDVREPVPCTCYESCRLLCVGECGCDACHRTFVAFCEDAGCIP